MLQLPSSFPNSAYASGALPVICDISPRVHAGMSYGQGFQKIEIF